jgi:hypothetical protein
LLTIDAAAAGAKVRADAAIADTVAADGSVRYWCGAAARIRRVTNVLGALVAVIALAGEWQAGASETSAGISIAESTVRLVDEFTDPPRRSKS